MRKLEINIVIGGENRVVALVISYSHISFKARKSFFSRFGYRKSLCAVCW